MSPPRKISQEKELLLVRLQVERSTEKDKKRHGWGGEAFKPKKKKECEPGEEKG